MNYKRIHDSIIDRAKTRTINPLEYYESHHIIPKCLGGFNGKENLVQLTAREHYLIHWLLVKMYPKEWKLVYAWRRMMHPTSLASVKGDRYTSHSFKYAREAFNQTNKILWNTEEYREITRRTHTGRNVSEETREKLRSVDRSYTKTDEYRQNMSEATKGSKNGMFNKKHSEESKLKMSENRDALKTSRDTTNQWQNEEIRKKMMEAMKGPRKKRTCPHCNFIGAGGAMTRYHFDNCKEKL